MFGYVRIAPSALDDLSYRHYQGVYCSLCKQLGKRYGLLARMTLNYDLTFLALLRLAIQKNECTFTEGTCSFSPLCRRLCCSDSAVLAETADISILLTYHKLADNAADERGIQRVFYRILRILFARKYRRAAAHQPHIEQQIVAYMQQQTALETARTASVDAAAHPFAEWLALLLQTLHPDPALYRFGYCLGRWIYLSDAVDDLPRDIAQGNYNPYAQVHKLSSESDKETIQTVQQYGLESLNMSLAACKEAYDRLPVQRFDSIFRNVLYTGMPSIQHDILVTKRERRALARQMKKRMRDV